MVNTNIFKENFRIDNTDTDYVIALAGNPNTGKSTVFNALTGLNQHTGNWPGKTVARAEGRYINQGMKYKLVDLPGSYSLLANSVDEQITRDFLCFGMPNATVVVVDATCLERNLNLALQVLEITSNVVICVNLLDEAKRKNIEVDLEALTEELGVPVVGTVARGGLGLKQLVNAVTDVVTGSVKTTPYVVKYSDDIEEAIGLIEPKIKKIIGNYFNSRWLALRFLDHDQTIINALEKWLGEVNNRHELRSTGENFKGCRIS